MFSNPQINSYGAHVGLVLWTDDVDAAHTGLPAAGVRTVSPSRR